MNISSGLRSLIGKTALQDVHSKIDLPTIAREAFQRVELPKPNWMSFELFSVASAGELLIHLRGVMENDSCVQDVATTGHLLKLVARWDVWTKTKDYEIVGVPNVKLDEISRRERTDFFHEGVSLNRLSTNDSVIAARELFRREKDWIVSASVGPPRPAEFE